MGKMGPFHNAGLGLATEQVFVSNIEFQIPKHKMSAASRVAPAAIAFLGQEAFYIQLKRYLGR